MPSLSRASFLLLIVSIFFSSACSWFGRKHVTADLRRETVLGVQKAIEDAGTTDIWVKSGSASALRPSSAQGGGATIEVLALPASFGKAVGAIQRYGQTAGLHPEVGRPQIRRQGSNSSFVWREIVLKQGNEFVGRWRVREVPSLRRAAIVIDDLGQDIDAARTLLREPYPLTFSILPDLRYSAETAREAHSAGREVMLHLPMEPEPGSGANPGPGEIKLGMGADEVARTIQSNLSSVPFAGGVNNHMGSRATADAALMADVMRVLETDGLYFVDSRTTAATSALDAARRRGIPAFYRSVFLDDTETVPYTLQQLRAFRQSIEEQGVALAIGHPHPTTIEALSEFLPEFERADIQLVSASFLVHLPEAARLEPPHRANGHE